jgi:predicted permease
MWTRWRLWLASVFRRREFDRVIDAELTFHLQARIEHLQREGVPPAAAERQARLEIGALEKYKDELRDTRRGAWVEQLGQDLRYGARVLLGRPGFTVAATVTLALGVGATATVFSLLDVVLLRSLPVRNPHELAHIYTSCRAGDVYCASSYPEYLDYRSRSRTFADMAVFQPMDVSVSGDSGSWVGTGLLVSTNYFSLLGVAPLAGQLFSPAWNVAADPPVVLAHDAWVTHFGGDSSIFGRRLRLSGGSFRIVGVAPSWFNGTRLEMRPDLWMPIENISLLPVGASDPGSTSVAGSDMLTNRGRRWISGTVGRLRPGATIPQAQADMRAISDGLQQSDPGRERRFVTVEDATRAALPPMAARDIRRFVALLMGGVAATLLIACANVAGLLLARGAARRPELELRRALGAGRARLVRQLLTEYLLLAMAGTIAGIFVAKWAMALLAAYDLPGALHVASLDLKLDARVLMFAGVLFVFTGAFGLLPALGTIRGLAATTGSRTTGEDTGSARGQGPLLGAQVAVTVVLLIAAGLFIRSLQHGLALDLGLTSHSVLMAEIAPALEGYPPGRIQHVLDEAVARLARMPGIDGVAAARQPPLRRGSGFRAQDIEGYSPRPGEETRFESNFVGAGYFRILGIPLLAGREFGESDRAGAPLVGVISETMARRYWSGRNPIGTHVSSQSFDGPIEIVGIAADVTVGLDRTAEPFVYLSIRQHPRFLSAPMPLQLLVRTQSNPSAQAASIRGVLREVDPSVPVTAITTLDARIAELLMPQRLGSALLSTLAGLTLILVIVGVVGTVSYGVSRRRREIGVRLALGARRGQVVGALTHGALLVVAAGALAGVLTAVAVTGLVSSFLYGIEPTDSATLAMATTLLVVVSGIASLVPAWRAAGIDPAKILKAE